MHAFEEQDQVVAADGLPRRGIGEVVGDTVVDVMFLGVALGTLDRCEVGVEAALDRSVGPPRTGQVYPLVGRIPSVLISCRCGHRSSFGARADTLTHRLLELQIMV